MTMTIADFDAYPLCIRRALAMHASLMRVGVRAEEIFVGVAVDDEESTHLTLIVVVRVAGVQRMVCRCTEWDVPGVTRDDEERLLRLWVQAQKDWNAAPQGVRDEIFQAHRPNAGILAGALWESGLLMEMQARKAAS
jgi:hypothetical protein